MLLSFLSSRRSRYRQAGPLRIYDVRELVLAVTVSDIGALHRKEFILELCTERRVFAMFEEFVVFRA